MLLARATCTAAAAMLALPAFAAAGTVSKAGDTLSYASDPGSTASETVLIGAEAAKLIIEVDVGVTSDTVECTQQPDEPDRLSCPMPQLLIVNLSGGDDTLGTSSLTGSTVIEAHGQLGRDSFAGGPNNDRLYGGYDGDSIDGTAGDDLLDGGPGGDHLTGGAGGDTILGGDDDDTLYGGEGNDLMDGGAGGDGFQDGPGDDVVTGGPGNDSFSAGVGRDAFNGGDGSDRVDYGTRTAPVSVTLDGAADDGEIGEGDQAGGDVEEVVGGSANDHIVGNASANGLYGGAGNDTIAGSAGEDRVEGNEGDDTIDTRDGGYDSIDCGPGHDTVFADPGDGTSNCESAPGTADDGSPAAPAGHGSPADTDGDGYPAGNDCQPENPAVSPGQSEIYGNDVDEDCANGPGHFRVVNPISFKLEPSESRRRVRFRRLLIKGVRAGDVIVIRCFNRRRGCPLTKKTVTARSEQPALNVARILRRRYLSVGAVVEIRILRTGHIGKVQSYKVKRNLEVRSRGRCLPPGGTVPEACG